MFYRAFLAITCVAAIVVITHQPAAADNSNQPANSLDDIVDLYAPATGFIITRKGKPIGTHEVRFSRKNNELMVDVKSGIRVTVLKVPVFSFDYRSIEIWRDGELASVTSEVQENNKKTQVGMSSSQTQTNLVNPQGSEIVDRIFYTSNHWNPAVTNTSRVFNTLTGRASEVSIDRVTDEALVNGVTAIQYRYSGDITADVWYDSDGKWIKLAFKGDDGSLIEYTIDD